MGILDECRDRLCADVSYHKDELIRRAVNYKLGREDWSLSEIAGRGEFITYLDRRTVFSFDGEELIEFYPPVFANQISVDAHTLRANITYKILYHRGDINGQENT